MLALGSPPPPPFFLKIVCYFQKTLQIDAAHLLYRINKNIPLVRFWHRRLITSKYRFSDGTSVVPSRIIPCIKEFYNDETIFYSP